MSRTVVEHINHVRTQPAVAAADELLARRLRAKKARRFGEADECLQLLLDEHGVPRPLRGMAHPLQLGPQLRLWLGKKDEQGGASAE